jgi:uncharacterized protein
MDDSPIPVSRWQELSRSDCFVFLARNNVGRLAFVDDLGPIVIPVNYVLDQHVLVIRTDEGTKLRAADRGAKVAFEIDGTDAVSRSGWSVLVRGEAAAVTDPGELERLRKLPIRSLAPGSKPHYIRVLPALVTGRRILAPDEDGAGRWVAT